MEYRPVVLPRITYDDREEFPWLIRYGLGGAEVWAKYRTRQGAERDLERLLRFVKTYYGEAE